MLTKQYVDTYKGERIYELTIKNGKKIRTPIQIKNNIKYKNTSYIGLCFAGPTDLPLKHMSLPYPTFSYEQADFTVHDKTYEHKGNENTIPYRPMLSRPASLIYVAAFYKFETLFIFGMEDLTDKQGANISTVVDVYDDTDFVLVSASGNQQVPERLRWHTNFHHISWDRFKTLVQ